MAYKNTYEEARKKMIGLTGGPESPSLLRATPIPMQTGASIVAPEVQPIVAATAVEDSSKASPEESSIGNIPNAPALSGLLKSRAQAEEAAKRANEAAMAMPDYEMPEKVAAPIESEYKKNTEFVEKYIAKPLSEQDREKRVRGAYHVAGVGALGNALSSFSNLFFTGQGAPSQTLPTVQDPYAQVKDLNAEQRAIAENYLTRKMQANSADQGEYANAYNRYMQGVNARNNILQWIQKNKADAAANEFQRSWAMYESDVKSDQWDKGYRLNLDQFEEAKRHAKAQEALSRRQLEQSATQHRETMEYRKKMLDAEGGGSSYDPIEGADGGQYLFNSGFATPQSLQGLFSACGITVKDVQNRMRMSKLTSEKSQLQFMRALAGELIQSDPKALDYAYRNKLILDNPQDTYMTRPGGLDDDMEMPM